MQKPPLFCTVVIELYFILVIVLYFRILLFTMLFFSNTFLIHKLVCSGILK